MARKVSDSDPRPPYVQIAADIREQVESGELRVGDRLPSLRALASDYGVAQMTIHHALRILREEGRVESWQGRGSFITEPPAPPASDLSAQVQRLSETVRELGERLSKLESRSD